MTMLVSMLFDDDDESSVTGVWEIGKHFLTIKQRVQEGRQLDEEKERAQEQAMVQHAEGGPATSGREESAAQGAYDSAFPNVGLIVWQAGFVLADYLLRACPLGSWAGARVLELGCGTGQLGLPLAMAGADVTLTDLDHIVPLTQQNIGLNAGSCAIQPRAQPFMWGTDLAAAGLQGPWDMVVAADVLYEPQYYGLLLDSLAQLVLAPPAAAGRDKEAAACSSAGAGGQQGSQQGGREGEGAAGAVANGLQAASLSERAPAVAAEPQQPHGVSRPPLCYVCYRVRQYRERSFEERAQARGFDVSAVPLDQLHPDFACGGWRLIRLDPAAGGGVGAVQQPRAAVMEQQAAARVAGA